MCIPTELGHQGWISVPDSLTYYVSFGKSLIYFSLSFSIRLHNSFLLVITFIPTISKAMVQALFLFFNTT